MPPMQKHQVIGIAGIAITIALAVLLYQFIKFMGVQFALGILFMGLISQFGYYAAHGRWIELD